MDETPDLVLPRPPESEPTSAEIVDQRRQEPAPDPAAAVALPASPQLPPPTATNPPSEPPKRTLRELKALIQEAEEDEDKDRAIASMAQGPHTWLREAAILLAAASALLYIASHIYGSSYLAVYGIGDGFHGFGLANLSMLDFNEMILLAVSARLAYWTVHQSTWWKFGIGLTIIWIGTASSLAITGIVQDGLTDNDSAGIIVFIALASICMFATRALVLKFKRNHDRYQASFQSFLEKSASLSSKAETIRQTLPNDAISDIEEIASLNESIRRLLDAVKRQIRIFRLLIGVPVGFMVAVFVLPNFARSAAIFAARNQASEWKQPNGASPNRIPVYWIGDRIVYITNDGKECLVHLVIAGIEQAVRRCPEVITDASTPKDNKAPPSITGTKRP